MSQNQIDDIERRLDRGVLGYWYILAKASEVKSGTPTAVKALGRDLVLWRGEDGRVRCLEDYCPHRGARLSVGRQAGNTLACRYHGVVMDGEGTIVSVPGMKECALEGRRPISSYHVQEHSDAIFVYFPSADAPTPSELVLPKEIMDDGWSSFLCTAPWATSYRYVLDNVSDLMHGIYLHADTFTLGRGTTQDTVAVDRTATGFIIRRVGQQDTNFDWAEIITEGPTLHARVLIPYPPAAGPGGPMYVMTFLTPVDDKNCRIFFFRTRAFKSAFEREAWRFQFRAKLEPRAWDVLEQDRAMLEGMPKDARRREMLYQHDMGLTRIRQMLMKRVESEIRAEDDARKVG